MKRREAKVAFLLAHQGGKCAIISAVGDAVEKLDRHDPIELHHAAAHDTKHNRRMMPLFINSVWNLVLVSKYGHMKHRAFGCHSYEWAMRRERFLERHPKIAEWVNNPAKPLFHVNIPRWPTAPMR